MLYQHYSILAKVQKYKISTWKQLAGDGSLELRILLVFCRLRLLKLGTLSFVFLLFGMKNEMKFIRLTIELIEKPVPHFTGHKFTNGAKVRGQ